MDKSISRRIRDLESTAPNRLMALCTNLETGESKTMPLRDLIPEFELWKVERIIGGNNLHDLDAYLSAFLECVKGGSYG